MDYVLCTEIWNLKSIHSLTQSINLFIYPSTYLAISKLFECTNHEDETWKASAQTLPLMVNKGLSLQYGVTGNSFGGENNRRKFLVKNRRNASKQALQKCYCLAFLGTCDRKKNDQHSGWQTDQKEEIKVHREVTLPIILLFSII